MATKLMLEGLNRLDAEELKNATGSTGLEIVQGKTPDGTLAEPTTITAVLTLAPMIAGVFAKWISKPRRRKLIKQKIKVIRPDGTVEERELIIKDTNEEAAESQVLDQIAEWVKD